MLHGLHPVLFQPPGTVVLDLTSPAAVFPRTPWSIGRYDEARPGVYTTDLFAGGRSVHVGIDLGGPAGTAVHAFAWGRVVHVGENPAPGDYGNVLVTEHDLVLPGGRGGPLYALWGHLSAASRRRWRPGRAFSAGTVLGWLGEPHENGGWPPHLHLQLSLERPETHDLPGAVAPADRAAALERFPDPRLVLGPLY